MKFIYTFVSISLILYFIFILIKNSKCIFNMIQSEKLKTIETSYSSYDKSSFVAFHFEQSFFFPILQLKSKE